MNLNHLNLTVADVQATYRFLGDFSLISTSIRAPGTIFARHPDLDRR